METVDFVLCAVWPRFINLKRKWRDVMFIVQDIFIICFTRNGIKKKIYCYTVYFIMIAASDRVTDKTIVYNSWNVYLTCQQFN